MVSRRWILHPFLFLLDPLPAQWNLEPHGGKLFHRNNPPCRAAQSFDMLLELLWTITQCPNLQPTLSTEPVNKMWVHVHVGYIKILRTTYNRYNSLSQSCIMPYVYFKTIIIIILILFQQHAKGYLKYKNSHDNVRIGVDTAILQLTFPFVGGSWM